MAREISLFEAIRTQRAIRRFRADPVSDEAITRVLEAAIRAPSPGNRQSWYFLVVRDPETKRRIGEYYWQATLEAQREPGYAQIASSPVYRSADDLARRIGEVPVMVLACVEVRGGAAGPPGRGPITLGAAIYPAVQNLMLAARGLGLGTCLTTRHRRFEREVKELLGIPDHVETAALIPLGYPAEGEHFGGSRRRPTTEVAFYERWGRKKASA
ncbi:MAG: nitroreductase family protein [Chloroflexi bacterium]|nr:nitroreductase family protein [Chloroflexota bacterium]